MSRRPTDLPDFSNPPVVEVVLGLQFETLRGFRTVHYGKLWERFQDTFPGFQEKGRLDPVFETFGMRGEGSHARLSVTSEPPLPRLWMLSDPDPQNAMELIQFQPDKFLHNWRKTGDANTYPRYENIKDKFLGEVEVVSSFLRGNELGDITPNQWEITYINHIQIDQSDHLHACPEKIFSFFAGFSGKGFENTDLRARYEIRNDGEPFGRLHLDLEPRRLGDGKEVYLLNLTARGRPLGNTIEGISTGIDIGREAVVRTFADVSTEDMHKRWGRTQ